MTKRQVCLLVLVACGAGLFAGCTAPSSAVRLTLEFSTMGNYAGHMLEARVVTPGGTEVDRESIGAVSAAQFAISFSGLEEDAAYRVDFYVDVNDNGRYDAPPTDHAWRIDVPASKGDRSVAFTPGGAFTDIAFPVLPAPGPAADGVISPGEYRHTIAFSCDYLARPAVKLYEVSATLAISLAIENLKRAIAERAITIINSVTK